MNRKKTEEERLLGADIWRYLNMLSYLDSLGIKTLEELKRRLPCPTQPIQLFQFGEAFKVPVNTDEYFIATVKELTGKDSATHMEVLDAVIAHGYDLCMREDRKWLCKVFQSEFSGKMFPGLYMAMASLKDISPDGLSYGKPSYVHTVYHCKSTPAGLSRLTIGSCYFDGNKLWSGELRFVFCRRSKP